MMPDVRVVPASEKNPATLYAQVWVTSHGDVRLSSAFGGDMLQIALAFRAIAVAAHHEAEVLLADLQEQILFNGHSRPKQ